MKIKMALILALVFALSACSSGGNTSETDNTQDSGQTTVSEETTTETEGSPPIPDLAAYETLSPSLYELHEDYFKIGVAVGERHTTNPVYENIIVKSFNSITSENEMKPDYVLDQYASASDLDKNNLSPVINTKSMDVALKYAVKHNMTLRYHTLVWHSQTPKWLFKEGYSLDPEAPNVTREVMLQRMENYIKQVLEYCDANYPGVVSAVDVVNEAIEVGDSRADGIRTTDNMWFEVIGEDYVEYAFTYARKYAPDYMKLFYNDYGCDGLSKRIHISNMLEKLVEKGVIDGIGMQSHYSMGSPTTMQVQETIQAFAELGLEIQITELDISCDDDSDEAQLDLAIRYKKLMNVYRNLVDQGMANITSVTVWGTIDSHSWLRKDGKRFPLLFNGDLEPKPSFWGFYLHDSIPNY